MRHTRTHKHLFSLVELLVAVAVLSLMMTFLFQFILSAQRVWSGTTNASNVYAQAQVALDVIGNDLQNIVFSSEPARQCPFYLNVNGDDIYFAFVSRIPSSETGNGSWEKAIKNAGTYLVCYFYDKSEEKLYRVPMDTRYFDGIQNYPFYFQGYDPTHMDYISFFFNSTPFAGRQDKFDVLAENLLDCKITLQFDPNKFDNNPATTDKPYPMTGSTDTVNLGFAKEELPIAIRLTLDIYDPNSIRSDSPTQEQKESTSRSFSKVIFLR